MCTCKKHPDNCCSGNTSLLRHVGRDVATPVQYGLHGAIPGLDISGGSDTHLPLVRVIQPKSYTCSDGEWTESSAEDWKIDSSAWVSNPHRTWVRPHLTLFLPRRSSIHLVGIPMERSLQLRSCTHSGEGTHNFCFVCNTRPYLHLGAGWHTCTKHHYSLWTRCR